MLENITATDNIDSNSSPFDFDAINEMCNLEIQLANLKSYETFCQIRMLSKTCCRPWSIPNYMAFLSNKSSCVDLEVISLLGMDLSFTQLLNFNEFGLGRRETLQV